MDNLLYQYALQTYGEDVTYLIEKSFDLFEDFDLSDYETSFFDIISSDSIMDATDMHDSFYGLVIRNVTTILSAHGIILNDSATLREMNEIVDSIKILQNLLDYNEVYDILESDEDELIKFAKIMESISPLDYTRVMDIVEDFDEYFLQSLKILIRKKIKNSPDLLLGYDEMITKIINNARRFEVFINNTPSIGIQLLNQNLLLGEDFEAYIPFIDEHIKMIQDVKVLSSNLYSVIILSKDGFINPIATYKKNINKLSVDNNLLNNLEISFNNFCSEFESYKKGTSVFK